jgi:dephospho-CoA kinase
VERIAAEFGQELVDGQGNLDRRRLAQIAFGCAERVARLNAITHPAILELIERRIEEIAGSGRYRVICLVAPLLLEAGCGPGRAVDRVLLMAADEQERIRRVVERDGLTGEEVKGRIAAQMPLAEARRRADWVVDTSAGREQALQQLERVWSELQAE